MEHVTSELRKTCEEVACPYADCGAPPLHTMEGKLHAPV